MLGSNRNRLRSKNCIKLREDPTVRSSRIQIRLRVARSITVCTLAFLAQLVIEPERGWTQTATTDNNSIVVTGIGERLVRPQVLVLSFDLEASHENSAKAVSKLRADKSSLVESLQASQAIRSQLEFSGRQLQYRKPAQANATAEADLQEQAQRQPSEVFIASETVRVTFLDISIVSEDQLFEAVTQVLEIAGQEGRAIRPANPMLRYEVENVESIRESLYDVALRDARAKAELLARLSGLTLASIDRIDQVAESSPTNLGGSKDPDAKTTALPSFQERQKAVSSLAQPTRIRVSVRVRYRFGPKNLR